MTRDYVRRWLANELRQLFVDDDYAEVVNWMSIHRGIPKVVLIGSGFSRNAVLKSGLKGRIDERTPLWPQVTEALRRGLGYRNPNEGPSDPLLLAEQCQESIGVTEFRTLLLKMLKNEELEPGAAHNALQKFPAEAIITTNQLDTLLDRMEGRWHPVIGAGDLPLSRAQSSLAEMKGSAQIIYLHGHRSLPETWVFSRSEYEDINSLRPALVNRVQQLLTEYPLLVLGYSLSDPDFHALFRIVHCRLESCKPRALCVTVGTKRPLRAEKTHWLNLGMYLAHMRDPGNDDYAPGLARFLRLEENLPSTSYVKDSLNELGHGSVTSILSSRLNELRSIYDELEKLEPSDHALAELYYESWKTCFPGLDKHEEDAKTREERLTQQRLAVCHGQGARLRGTQQPNSVPELRNLPVERFVHFCSRRVSAYVYAVDKLLEQEEHHCVALAIAEWIAFAIERHVLRGRPVTLDYGENEVLREVLGWCAEQAPGDSRSERYQVLLKLCVRDNLDLLLVSTQSRGAWERSLNALPQMDEAWRAVWSVNHDVALAKYDEAARVFRRRGDSLGEWAALVGVIYSARELTWGIRFRQPDDVRCAELEKRIAEAQWGLAELEQRRPVRRFLGWKRRVTKEALMMAERAASEPSREPGQRRTRFSSTRGSCSRFSMNSRPCAVIRASCTKAWNWRSSWMYSPTGALLT